MGVTITNSTIPGGVTPICNSCGVALCWDLSEDDYYEARDFWDDWECKDCNPNYKGALKRFLDERGANS
jgi:hypothetical protein